MSHLIHEMGIAKLIGRYSDAIEIAPNQRWLISAGTPGLRADGTLPEGITAQAEQAWQHLTAMLERAHMSVQDLIKVTSYLLRPEDIAPYVAVRNRYLGDARPAAMLAVVPQLVRPDFLVEIEIIAARA